MIKCNDCPHRGTFTMVIEKAQFSYPWCKKDMKYIKLDAYMVNCSVNKDEVKTYNAKVTNPLRIFWRMLLGKSKEIPMIAEEENISRIINNIIKETRK